MRPVPKLLPIIRGHHLPGRFSVLAFFWTHSPAEPTIRLFPLWKCSGRSMSRQQLCIDVKTRQNWNEKLPDQPQTELSTRMRLLSSHERYSLFASAVFYPKKNLSFTCSLQVFLWLQPFEAWFKLFYFSFHPPPIAIFVRVSNVPFLLLHLFPNNHCHEFFLILDQGMFIFQKATVWILICLSLLRILSPILEIYFFIKQFPYPAFIAV